MGCATQELTAAASQQQTEKSPPSQNSGSTYQLPTNNGPTMTTTKLKQSHSALVRLLESAPISTPAPSPPAHTDQQHQTLEVAVDHKTTTSTTTNQHHHYRKKMVKLLEHIKSNSSDSDISKSLESSSSQKVISDNVKCVSNVSQMCPAQGPISCSGSDEDDAKPTAPLPWKKTRIAREWRQKKQQDETATPTVVVSPPPTTQTETTAASSTEQAASAVQPMDTDEEDVDMCEHHILENLYHNDGDDHICRRNSLESCSDGGGHNDSGCDSDCPDNNINELCKRFDENLTDEDGFFRRSIQQKIQYRPCTKNQQCSILRINRNRCQYCRLKKCIAVGMSRDAVRFGRVPKREKARILAAMQQSTQNRGNQRALATELDDQPRLLASVLRAHMETCEFTREKVTQMRQRARDCPSYSMPTLACPLNPAPELQSEQEFSQRFAHVIRGVIDFAGMILGFQMLTQDDKFTLLKAGLFDALFVRLICMFDSSINSIICLNGQVMRRDSIQNGANARFLVDSTFNFAERMNSMQLTDAEIGLFCAIVLITPDRPGLRNVDLIERMYSKLKACLQSVITQNRPDKPEFMQELLKTLPDLRTLSTLHTEKLVVFRTEHKELLRQQMWTAEEEAAAAAGKSASWDNGSSVEDIAKSPMGSVSSTESGDTYSSSDYGSSMANSAPLLAATLSGGCPMRHRASSGSSAEDDIVGAAHLAQNGLTITPVVRAVPITAHHIRCRKLDSPTDSGIESGNEKHEHKVPSSGSSSCSSPRSSFEDQTEDKRHIEDMPVLKRVLQAPPLYDTNSLMDEAYKPHKKFRAMRHRESESDEPQSSTHQSASSSPPQHQSQLHMHLTRPQTNNNNNGHGAASVQQLQQQQQQHHQQQQQLQQQQQQQQVQQHQTTASLLSSTHSVLAKSLMAEPRMTPEQMKRSDIIQNYIMRESQHAAGLFKSQILSSPHHSSSAASSPSISASGQPQGLLVAASPSPNPASGCPYSSGRWSSVITTTTNRQQTPSPPNNQADHHRYFQSPHSTSTSPPSASSPSAAASPSPRLLELQVDCIATGNGSTAATSVAVAPASTSGAEAPLNLSKKSPSPPPRKVMLEA